MILKNQTRKLFGDFLIFFFEKIEKSSKKSGLIFQNYFSSRKKIFFDGIFLNLISCFRRVVLKQFRHNSITLDASLKNVCFGQKNMKFSLKSHICQSTADLKDITGYHKFCSIFFNDKELGPLNWRNRTGTASKRFSLTRR